MSAGLNTSLILEHGKLKRLDFLKSVGVAHEQDDDQGRHLASALFQFIVVSSYAIASFK